MFTEIRIPINRTVSIFSRANVIEDIGVSFVGWLAEKQNARGAGKKRIQIRKFAWKSLFRNPNS